MKIKIIFDISVLGHGNGCKISKTGVFRVTENLLLQLAKNEHIQLFLCSSRKNYIECTNYLRMSDCFKESDIIYSNKFFESSKLYLKHKIDSLTKKIHHKNFFLFNLFFKVIRKICYKIFHFIEEKDKNNVIPQKILKKANIYQSCFHSIPKQIRNNKNIKKFLMIHDLIPILFPHYFNETERNLILHTINEIEDENIICVSDSTKKDLINYKKDLNLEKIMVSLLGVSENLSKIEDLQEIEKIKTKYHIPKGSKYVLSLSTIEPRKNIQQSIKAFVKLIEENNIADLYLVLCGIKGWHYDNIFSLIENYSTHKDKIIFSGFVDEEDLVYIYSGALVFIFPSFYEGFGLPCLEAMKCGVPVIASNRSSIPEVVGDGGILIDPDNETEITKSILEIYKNPTLREELSKKSLQQSKKFSWDKFGNEVVDFYLK